MSGLLFFIFASCALLNIECHTKKEHPQNIQSLNLILVTHFCKILDLIFNLNLSTS